MKKSTRFSFTIAMFLITINSFAANFYWVNGSGNWSDTSHWAFSSGGTIFHSQWPGGTDNVFFDANSFSSPGQIVTLDQGITNCADMTWTTLPTAFPVLYGDSSKTFRIYGSLTIATVIGFNFNGQVIMESMTAGKTITTSGTPINFHWTFNGAGGGWTFQDALMGSSVIDFINGTLNTNNQTINASAFYSTSGGARTMIMGSSIFNLKGFNNTLWNINPLGMNLNAGTSTINGTSTIGSVGNFYGGGLTYYNLSFADSAAIFGNNTFHDVAFVSDGFISGNNTFNDVSFFLRAIINGNSTFNNVIMSGNGNISGNNIFNNLTFSPWWTYTLQAGATQTIGNICAQGTGALPIRIQSSSAGLPAIISKSSGTICWDYVRVSDLTATGGAIFNAGLAPINSQDLGGNTGLLFTGGCTAMSCLSSCNPPSITMQPINSSVCLGSNAVFTITATGTDLTYQWQVNQGLGFINLNNNLQYSGVTSNTLSIIAPAILFNGYQYRCAAVGACPIVSMSFAATLTVKPSPTVTVNSATICSGQTAILTASAGTVFVPVAPSLPPSPPLPPPPTTTSYIWSTGETTNSISVAPSTTNTYTVTATTNGCSGTAIATVTVYPMSTINAGLDTTVGSNTPIQLGSSSVSGISYNWSPVTGLSNATVSNPTLILQNNGSTPQTYTYILNATNGQCIKTDTVLITITPIQTSLNLGTAKPFGLLSGGSISSTDTAFVSGEVGSLAAVSNKIIATDGYESGSSIVNTALADLSNTKSYCTAQTGTTISGTLSGQTLSSGVYKIIGNANMDGILVLTGDTNSVFIFNITDSLIVSPLSFLNKGNVRPENIYWNVSKSAVVNGNVTFFGIIMAGLQSNLDLVNRGLTSVLCMQSILISTNNYYPGDNAFYSWNILKSIPTSIQSLCTPACNLVCNPGFETADLTLCSTGSGITYGYAPPWSAPTNGTSDLFNSSCGPWLGIPNNSTGSQAAIPSAAVTGTSGYAGFYAHVQSSTNNYREYLKGQFSSPLIGGHCYYFEMYVSLADQCAFAVDKMGAFISSTSISIPLFNSVLSSYTPQINNTSGVLNNSSAFVRISGFYTASGGEQYVYIGNFNNDATSNITPANGTWLFAYYYLDNVLLSELKVNAGPDLTITCGTSIQLMASIPSCLTTVSGLTYSWSPSAGMLGSNTASPLISPTSTTTYTVVVSTPDGCSVTDMVTVNANYPVAVTVTPQPLTICPGQTVTLTASGATTYNWSEGGATTNSITISPTATTTYTVTGTTNGCTTTTTATVTVLHIPTITVNSPTICSGQTATLTASSSGVSYYSWSTGETINPITVSPTTTTTYTVTGTNNFNSCSSTEIATVTVLNCPPPECLIPVDWDIHPGNTVTTAFPGLSSLGGKTIRITGTLTIDHDFEFSACRIIMVPNGTVPAKIIVANNATLTLSPNTHQPGTHIYGCQVMWSGIEVQSGGKIIDLKSSIEDALCAVKINQGGKGNFASAIFNRNLIGIELTSNSAAISPVTISGTIFTSRTLNGGGVISNYTSYGFWSTLTTYTEANLKSPYTNIKGLYGIKATDVKFLNVGVTDVANNFNGFDKIMCGINLIRTNAIILNNKFQYLLGYSSLNWPIPPNEDGYGIKATGTTTGAYFVTIGGSGNNQPNTFNSIYRAVEINNYKTTTILNNSLDNINTYSGSYLGYGQKGIVVKPASNNTIDIENNSINNCADAIWINRGNTYSISTVSLKVDHNRPITANSLGYCNNGVLVTDLLNGTNVTPTLSEIIDNGISECVNGINLLHIKKTINVNANYSSVRYFNLGSNSVSTGGRNGIKISGCQNLKINNNHIQYDDQGGIFSGGNLNASGIYLQLSSNMLVKCNLIEDAARSLVFEGNCLSSPYFVNYGIEQNTMRRAQDGFVLLNNGVIGQQGASGNFFNFASNNYWDRSTSPNFSNSETYTKNTFNANSASKLYMNNIPSGANATMPIPFLNKTFDFPIYAYSFGSGLNISSAIPPPCGSVPPHSPSTGGNSVANAYGNELKDLLADSVNLPLYLVETNWQRKKFVYNELNNNSQLNAFNGLANFHNHTSAGNIGRLELVEKKIEQGNYTAANAILNTITPDNIPEQNQFTINDLILKELINTNYVYTSTDSSTLYSLAIQCPLSGGDAVYQSRVLLMTIENNVIDFIDNCDVGSGRMMNNLLGSSNEPGQLFKLYPNPNNGNMILDYSLNATDRAEILIYDIAGKLIAKYELNVSANQMTISNDRLNRGIYFYRIKVNDKIVQNDKMIIIK